MRFKEISLIKAVVKYGLFLKRVLFHRKKIAKNLERPLQALSANFERLGGGIATVSYLVLILFESSSISYLEKFRLVFPILILLLLSATMMTVSIRSRYDSLLFTIFYLVLFLIVYYYPAVLSLDSFRRNGEEKFLIHLSFLITQIFRPGRFPGVVVILLLLVHVTASLIFDSDMHNQAEGLHLLFFIWTALISLFIERILYNNSISYLELKDQENKEEDELKLAEKVHFNLFPTFRENKKIRIFEYRSPEHITGGDFFDLIHLREGNLGFFLTDISGHGISSAMMSAAMKVILSRMPYSFRLSPEKFLTRLDDIMYHDYGSHHASAIYIFFNFHLRQAKIGNAGHMPILLSRKGEPFVEVETTGCLIGFNLDRPVVKEKRFQIRRGDRFLLYTDGLIEFVNEEGFIPEVPPITEIVQGLEKMPGDELIGGVLNRIKSRPDFNRFRDDVMLILLEMK